MAIKKEDPLVTKYQEDRIMVELRRGQYQMRNQQVTKIIKMEVEMREMLLKEL